MVSFLTAQSGRENTPDTNGADGAYNLVQAARGSVLLELAPMRSARG
jgi:hypothetical protein